MKKFFFTFGTDPMYPYSIDEYVMVEAADIHEAIALFKQYHPNRPHSNCVNCAFYYSEDEFRTHCAKYYKGEPIETITRNGRRLL